MDEVLARQLTRQITILNRWIKLLATIFLIGFVILSILAYKAYTYAHRLESKVTSLEQTTSQKLDIQKQACDSGFLQKVSGACN